MNVSIPGIDNEKAILNSGSEELFIELLGDVYKIIDDKCALVETYLKDEDLKNYTTQVHALKTTCRTIGAIELGEAFFNLENIGKENNLEQAQKLTPDVLNTFRSLKPYLEPFAAKDNGPKSEFDKDAVSACLNKLVTAIDDFDLGSGEEAIKQLTSYSYSQELAGKIEALEKLVSNLDYDEAKELIAQIQGIL